MQKNKQTNKKKQKKNRLTEDHSWNIPGNIWSDYLQRIPFFPQVDISTMSFEHNNGKHKSVKANMNKGSPNIRKWVGYLFKM